MKLPRILGIFVIAIALVAIVWQRSALSGLRVQNDILDPLHEESARLKAENLEMASVRAMATTQTLSNDGKAELLRLRNDVGRLRAQRAELDRLRSENSRLAAAVDAAAGSEQKFSQMEGFMAKESWSNAGFDTPEAAIQTFFWAMREGDIARVAECVPEKDRRYLAALAEPGHEQEREKLLGDFRGMIESTGYRIVEKVVQEEAYVTSDSPPQGGGPRVPTKVLLQLQAVAGGAVWPVSLKWCPDGWKLNDI